MSSPTTTAPKLTREQSAAFRRLEQLRRSMGPGLQKPTTHAFAIAIAPSGDFHKTMAISRASI